VIEGRVPGAFQEKKVKKSPLTSFEKGGLLKGIILKSPPFQKGDFEGF